MKNIYIYKDVNIRFLKFDIGIMFWMYGYDYLYR